MAQQKKERLPEKMRMEYKMEGCVNGHDFAIEAVGTGNPYAGHQIVHVTKGLPLPFSIDLLSAVHQYGNRCFTNYQDAGIADYFKQAFPGGLSWERSLQFEDGGFAAASARISLKGNCFEHRSKVIGVNFPANNPIMQKKTLGWEPSMEKITVRDGILKGDVTMFLMLEGGGNHKCHFTTTYKADNPKDWADIEQGQKSHFIRHCLTRKTNDDGTHELQEDAVACK